jgi:glyoxylase-like metal-dependent hydrolase (beta-lactamase superfamily II)
MDVTAKFLGGSGVVTGSKYLIDLGDFEFLVDCGLFQGKKELRELNWDAFPMPLEDLEAILLTHAHLDHIGYLPRLVKQGFKTSPKYYFLIQENFKKKRLNLLEKKGILGTMIPKRFTPRKMRKPSFDCWYLKHLKLPFRFIHPSRSPFTMLAIS